MAKNILLTQVLSTSVVPETLLSPVDTPPSQGTLKPWGLSIRKGNAPLAGSSCVLTTSPNTCPRNLLEFLKWSHMPLPESPAPDGDWPPWRGQWRTWEGRMGLGLSGGVDGNERLQGDCRAWLKGQG